jgi:C1A family cysteine protease
MVATIQAERPKQHSIQWFGYRRDRLDRRDYAFDATGVELPQSVDLRQTGFVPPVMDQGELGSCTANGITAVLRYAMMKEGKPDVPLSRLQLYWDERALEGTIKEDSGAEIRDGIKCAASLGVANEKLWPYNIDRFKQKPFANVYKGALKFRALTYQRVGSPDGAVTANQIKAALAKGFPVVGGFNVFEQFVGKQAAATGDIEMPGHREPPIGGHCTYMWGYGQRAGRISSRNSWGDWGDKGDFYFPEAYLEQQGSDFWIINSE